MCLLAFYPSDVQPDRKACEVAAVNNPDGFGFAIVDKHRNQLITYRSMDSRKLIDLFVQTRQAHSDGPALFHARIGTGGTVSKLNCHPFQVGNDPLTVVAHNGIMPWSLQPKKNDPRCDTRIFAENHLPHRNWRSRKGLRKLGRFLGTDKAVILTANPVYQDRAYLINPGRGIWDKEQGIWYSNYSWRDWYGSYAYNSQTYGYRYVDPDDGDNCWNFDQGYHPYDETFCRTGEGEPVRCVKVTWRRAIPEPRSAATPPLFSRTSDPCLYCGHIGTVSSVTLYCTECNYCNECGFKTEECLCYVPARLDREREQGGRDHGTQ